MHFLPAAGGVFDENQFSAERRDVAGFLKGSIHFSSDLTLLRFSCLCDSQMRDNPGVLPPVRRIGGKSERDRTGKGDERIAWSGHEIDHPGKPAHLREAEGKLSCVRDGRPHPLEDLRGNVLGRHERIQHGDVRRHAKPGRRIVLLAVVRDMRLGLRNGNDER